MLHFILGPSGSGKSYQMLAELRTRAERGERSILMVPEQFTSSTEGVLYRTLGDSLSAYVESYSFTSLSEALLRRYGGAAVPTLTEAGRALLLRRAADSLLDKVVYYSRQRRSAAFCEKAAQTISELKSAGVTPEMLAEYAKTPGADREKLDELALIYNAYEGLLAQSAMDPGRPPAACGGAAGRGILRGPGRFHRRVRHLQRAQACPAGGHAAGGRRDGLPVLRR